MRPDQTPDWRRWGPALPTPAGRDVLRTSVGAAIGLAIAALVVVLDGLYAPELALHLFAPLGASAVLLFAVPNGPLSQPYSCVVGNLSAALWTVAVLHVLPQWAWAPAAVGGAIACMQLLRCLHPPGGAVALLLSLSPEAALSQPLPLLLLQVGGMTAVLVVAAWAYHRLTGRRYPHASAVVPAPAGERLRLSVPELEALLQRFDQTPNLDVQGLSQLLTGAEEMAIRQRFGGITCGTLMQMAPVVARPNERLGRIARRFARHTIKSMPVVNASGEVLGLLTRSALFEHLWSAQRRWRLNRGQPPMAGQRLQQHLGLLHRPALMVDVDTPVGQLLTALARHAEPCVPVLGQGRLMGVITRTDLMQLLLPQAGDLSGAPPSGPSAMPNPDR